MSTPPDPEFPDPSESKSTDPEPHEDTSSDDSPRRHRGRRRWGIGLIVAGAVIFLTCGWVGWQTYQAYRHLDQAREQLLTLKSDLDSLSLDSLGEDLWSDARPELAALQTETNAAVAAADDPLVRLAGHLPLIGPNLRAVSDLSGAADELADRVLPALLETGAQLSSSGLTPQDGRIDPAPVVDLTAALADASAALDSMNGRLAAVDPAVVVAPVADALVQFRSQLDDLRQIVDTGARTGRIVSGLLGASGERHFLLVFQNLAEPRATGGIPGSYALLTVVDGRPTLTGQGSASRDLGEYEPPVTPPAGADLPPELYHGLPMRFPMDATMTPDFPTAAQLLVSMYTRTTGVHVDGVIAVDPIVLQRLLEGSAPLPVVGGNPIPVDDLALYLLSSVYEDFAGSTDPRARDAVLSAVTSAAFTQLLGQDAGVLVRGVQEGVEDHRILAWAGDAALQGDLVAAGMAGDLASGPADFGVYRNDGTGGKVGFWTDGAVKLVKNSCNPEQVTFTLSVDLDYTPPDKPLPEYVTGAAPAGTGVLRTNVMVFAPQGAEWGTIQVDGSPAPAVLSTQSGHPVAMVTIDQSARTGSSVVMTGTLTGPRPNSGAIRVTPGVTDWKITSEVSACT